MPEILQNPEEPIGENLGESSPEDKDENAEKRQRFAEQVKSLRDMLSQDPERLMTKIILLDGYIYSAPDFLNEDPDLQQEITAIQDQVKGELKEKYQFSTIPVVPGETRFDYRFHAVQSMTDYVYTDQKWRDGLIAGVIGNGYQKGNKCMVPVAVKVYRNDPEYKK